VSGKSKERATFLIIKDVRLFSNEKEDVMIKDRQRLTSKLIATCLDAGQISYTIDKDGDFHIISSQKSFALYISIKSSSALRFMCIYPNPIPPRKYAEALMAFNTFHRETNYGHAYITKTNDNDYYAIYEHFINFEDGMLSENYFLKELLPTIAAHGMEFHAIINKYCNI